MISILQYYKIDIKELSSRDIAAIKLKPTKYQ
jgi:hypothetical protein